MAYSIVCGQPAIEETMTQLPCNRANLFALYTEFRTFRAIIAHLA
jgi:hypothetical protein